MFAFNDRDWISRGVSVKNLTETTPLSILSEVSCIERQDEDDDAFNSTAEAVQLEAYYPEIARL